MTASKPKMVEAAPNFDKAVDWLLNSHYVPLEAVTHFWHISDAVDCDCDDGYSDV